MSFPFGNEIGNAYIKKVNGLRLTPSLISNSAEPLRRLCVTRRFKALQANLARHEAWEIYYAELETRATAA